MRTPILSALALAAASLAASAQTTYVSQPPDHGTSATVWFSDIATYDPLWATTQILGDDLIVAPGDRITPTKLTWWGADYKATFTGADQFTVEIREDDGFGIPGVLLYSNTVQPTVTVTGWQPTGVFMPWAEKRYELDTTGAPLLESGHYFVVIFNETTWTSDGTWGWAGADTNHPASEAGFVFSDQAGAVWYPPNPLKDGLAWELEGDLLLPLEADVTSISLATGGTQTLSLDAGAASGGSLYFLAGSLSGSAPGFDLGSVHVPLNVDGYLLYTLGNPNSAFLPSSFGTLDPMGRGTAYVSLFALSDPALIGLSADHAYVVLDPLTLDVTMASNAISVSVAP